MSYYPEPDSHTWDKVKVKGAWEKFMPLIRFSFWKDFIALKAEVDKLEINKLFLHEVV